MPTASGTSMIDVGSYGTIKEQIPNTPTPKIFQAIRILKDTAIFKG